MVVFIFVFALSAAILCPATRTFDSEHLRHEAVFTATDLSGALIVREYELKPRLFLFSTTFFAFIQLLLSWLTTFFFLTYFLLCRFFDRLNDLCLLNNKHIKRAEALSCLLEVIELMSDTHVKLETWEFDAAVFLNIIHLDVISHGLRIFLHFFLDELTIYESVHRLSFDTLLSFVCQPSLI